MDTFPALQQDMLTVIKHCNAVILLARRVRSDCTMGHSGGLHADLVEMSKETEKLHEFAEACAFTTDHIETED